MFKPIRLTDCVTVHSVYDPGIDWDRMIERDLDERKKEDPNAQPLKLNELQLRIFTKAYAHPTESAKNFIVKNGERLLGFVIGVIQPDDATRIQDECRDHLNLAHWRSFLVGLRDLNNWHTTPKKKTINGVEYVDPQWIKENFALRGLRDVAIEVGAYVSAFNKLTDDEVSL